MLSATFIFLGILSLFSGVHGAQKTVPQHPRFTPLHSASPSQSISLTLGLPPTNMPGLHAALYDVSDPTSPKYGKYLTKTEVCPGRHHTHMMTDFRFIRLKHSLHQRQRVSRP